MARGPNNGEQMPIPNNAGQHGQSLTSNVNPTPMKLKNKFSFGLPQREPLLLMKFVYLFSKSSLSFLNMVYKHDEATEDIRV